jgi:conserved oligomeric Golgi complex subunit 6
MTTTSYFEEGIDSLNDGTPTPSTPLGNASSSAKAGAISGKITTLLSSSFADSDIRDALAILDAKGVKNDAETRRNLRQDAQKEVIECNAEIVADFGKVAEVWHNISRSAIGLRTAFSNSNGSAR